MIVLFFASLGWPVALVVLVWALELRRRTQALREREQQLRELDPGELDAHGVLEVLRGRLGWVPTSKTADRLQDVLGPLLTDPRSWRLLDAIRDDIRRRGHK